MKVFIGGSKTIPALNAEMRTAIDALCRRNAHILIGDCFGADCAVQRYLAEKQYRRVTVYVSGERIRNCVGQFAVKHIEVPDNIAGFSFYRQKDIAMAEDADRGLMLWDGITRGTLYNMRTLMALNK